MFSDLVVNIAILISFTFIWLQLFQTKRLTIHSPLYIKIFDGIIAGILGIILMHYSIQVSDTTILDLRHLPVMIVAFFGGFVPTVISAALISMGRFVISFNYSSIISLIMMFVLAFGASYLSHKVRLSDWKKWSVLLLYSQFVYSLALYIVVADYHSVLDVAVFHIISTGIGGMLLFYFVLYVRKNSELFHQYKEGSQRDHLTGLYNVRSFDLYYNSMISKAIRKDEDCAMCLVDIDHFKQINDSYGHPAGDGVIKQVASLLIESTRDIDIVSRNGGEEFSVLLPGCSIERAEEVAERIRRTVENRTFLLPDFSELKITVSVGVASYEKLVELEDTDDLYEEADRALYKAKQDGRNRVILATEVRV
ncbi:diguanylate cyclase [Bacillus mesophilus]|uniref:Diguanylate cyclase n=1 Tax=Bacillus mesophilus TaxID=1808955 RepID=A0A6M0Q799_9BACI|nr:diguanylate cyclase [Bacillus mesophilus]MBM7661567.1 diguanylate cyclase [Bacillus mesophilus]NEY72236.1 diguanylate cyclase [Bacillus mesophilus]